MQRWKVTARLAGHLRAGSQKRATRPRGHTQRPASRPRAARGLMQAGAPPSQASTRSHRPQRPGGQRVLSVGSWQPTGPASPVGTSGHQVSARWTAIADGERRQAERQHGASIRRRRPPAVRGERSTSRPGWRARGAGLRTGWRRWPGPRTSRAHPSTSGHRAAAEDRRPDRSVELAACVLPRTLDPSGRAAIAVCKEFLARVSFSLRCACCILQDACPAATPGNLQALRTRGRSSRTGQRRIA